MGEAAVAAQPHSLKFGSVSILMVLLVTCRNHWPVAWSIYERMERAAACHHWREHSTAPQSSSLNDMRRTAARSNARCARATTTILGWNKQSAHHFIGFGVSPRVVEVEHGLQAARWPVHRGEQALVTSKTVP